MRLTRREKRKLKLAVGICGAAAFSLLLVATLKNQKLNRTALLCASVTGLSMSIGDIIEGSR